MIVTESIEDDEAKARYFLLGEGACEIVPQRDDWTLDDLNLEGFGLLKYEEGKTSIDQVLEDVNGWMEVMEISEEQVNRILT